MKRIIFVNLHDNPMLVKVLAKFIFKQSFAVKHRYFLEYLLKREDVQVCTYINERGFSLVHSLPNVWLKILSPFKYVENYITLKKNGIDPAKIKVIKSVKEIKKDDIVIVYRHCSSSLYRLDEITSFKAMSMIHFTGSKAESDVLQNISPDVLFSESDLDKHCEIFKQLYGWYDKQIIIHPFSFEPRFQNRKPFTERINKAFATGTITYKSEPDFLRIYKNPCDQPSRKQIKDHSDELSDFILCTSSDYAENSKTVKTKRNNLFSRLYKGLHYKMFETQQKSYYSFDMVDSFNNYKMCIVGEEILGIPGIGFVEGMACGCAYIGQNKGYYEDYGMVEGVHYIGYDGSLDDLKAKISYYQKPENQSELESIAKAGYDFAKEHFSGEFAAKYLYEQLCAAHENWEKLNYERIR